VGTLRFIAALDNDFEFPFAGPALIFEYRHRFLVLVADIQDSMGLSGAVQ
jgi:hypothetical protein